MIGQNRDKCVSVNRLQMPSTRLNSGNIRRGVCFLLLCGSATDFLSKLIYGLVSAVETPIDELTVTLITAYLLTTLSFMASWVPPIVYAETRKNIRSLMTWKFLLKIMIPSLLDLLVTGFRYGAIIFVAPSVVSIVKTSIQLIVLTVISMCWRKKLHKKGQLLAIVGVFLGNGCVASSVLVGYDYSEYERSDSYIGLILACSSGVLGAIRNIMEEILLQDYGMTDNALLLLESLISFLSAGIAGVVLLQVFDLKIREYLKTWNTTGVIPAVCMFVMFMYGRDLGKLKLTKFSNAVTAKIVALVFPFGTWTLTLLIYFCATDRKGHPLGSAWHVPWSFVRLAGFVVIVISVWFFKFATQARKLTKETLRGSSFAGSYQKFEDAQVYFLVEEQDGSSGID